ncbi:MAG: RNA polymerase sigma factor [Vicinamibacterales bacterium]
MAQPPDTAPSTADETVRLLERARAGDAAALEDLFARHIPLLRRWASGRLPRWARDIVDTSDLVQETVLDTFKHLDGFEPRGEGALRAYLRQAFINRLRNQLRRAIRRPPAEALDSAVASDTTSPLEAAIGRETLERYERALERLDPDEREAVVTRIEFGLSYAEVAEALGRPSADAARMAVVRALVKLAKEMDVNV